MIVCPPSTMITFWGKSAFGQFSGRTSHENPGDMRSGGKSLSHKLNHWLTGNFNHGFIGLGCIVVQVPAFSPPARIMASYIMYTPLKSISDDVRSSLAAAFVQNFPYVPGLSAEPIRYRGWL